MLIRTLLLGIFVCGISARINLPAADDWSASEKVLDNKEFRNILVSFKNNDVPKIRESVQAQKFSSRTARIQTLHDRLKEHAQKTQKTVIETVRTHKSDRDLDIRPLWVTNQLIIKNADISLVKKLEGMDEVSDVVEDQVFRLQMPKVEKESGHWSPSEGETWGVVDIHAPEVWAMGYKGAGIVIADIDSGVRGTHEALRDGFRKENGWFDAAGNSPIPVDTVGHGTHTTGTIAGRGGIGVAPEAQWIACRGCDDDGLCSLNAFLQCGQWVICPTDPNGDNPRCDLAPHVASNSWGADGGHNFYESILKTWTSLDIAPIFSAGNTGTSGCSSHLSPADAALAISIGATGPDHKITYFSSLGPSALPGAYKKPEVAAPGTQILSASISGDGEYVTFSGTSMSCPHVAGLAALLYNRKPNLTYEQLREVLLAGALPVIPSGGSCGGIKDDVYPNNHAGYGRVSAKGSLEELNKRFPS